MLVHAWSGAGQQDHIERAVATLHPNHTYEKVVFDPWTQTTFDVNDTIGQTAALRLSSLKVTRARAAA